jgi:hypothetical protein
MRPFAAGLIIILVDKNLDSLAAGQYDKGNTFTIIEKRGAAPAR